MGTAIRAAHLACRLGAASADRHTPVGVERYERAAEALERVEEYESGQTTGQKKSGTEFVARRR